MEIVTDFLQPEAYMSIYSIVQ